MFSHNFRDLLDYMICDGFEEILLNGFEFFDDSGKPKIMLSWITFASAIFNSSHKSIHDLLIKVIIVKRLKYYYDFMIRNGKVKTWFFLIWQCCFAKILFNIIKLVK